MKKPMNLRSHKDFRREIINLRALDQTGEDDNKMIIEGQAVVFNQETILFSWDGVDYKEIIEANAFDNTDISQCFLKFNHDDSKVVARTKNKTLELQIREDGLYIRAEIINTTDGRDLYEMIQSGLIDKMSFAFSDTIEDFNDSTNTWIVKSIGKLWDVSAVTHPAYDATELHSLRFEMVESIQVEKVEALKRNKNASEISARVKKLELTLKLKK